MRRVSLKGSPEQSALERTFFSPDRQVLPRFMELHSCTTRLNPVTVRPAVTTALPVDDPSFPQLNTAPRCPRSRGATRTVASQSLLLSRCARSRSGTIPSSDAHISERHACRYRDLTAQRSQACPLLLRHQAALGWSLSQINSSAPKQAVARAMVLHTRLDFLQVLVGMPYFKVSKKKSLNHRLHLHPTTYPAT